MLAHPQGDIFRSLLSPHHNKRARCLRALFFAGIELFRSLDLDVFRMEYSQAENLLEIILFVKCQNLSNSIVFHYYAMNDVSQSRMIFEGTLSDMIEKFNEVIIFRGLTSIMCILKLFRRLSLTSCLSISATSPRSILLFETKIFTISVMAHTEVQSCTSLS